MPKHAANFRQRKEWKDLRLTIIERDKGCIVCPNKTTETLLHVHHIIPEGFKQFDRYRTDPTNLVTLCPTHHLMGKWSAHKNPIWFRQWMNTHRKGTLELAEQRLEDLERDDDN